MHTNVYEHIERMSALIRSEERRKCAELGLQVVHFHLLDFLAQCNKHSDTPAAIADYLGMTRGTVSQSLIVLEKKGLIAKHQDTVDKRVVRVKILSAGRVLLEALRPDQLFEQASEILQQREDCETVNDVFRHALAALQKARNGKSFGVCKTCRNFSYQDGGYFCLLTQLPLTVDESEQFCVEHAPVL
jgi:MarR family transcriptional regulator, negative regulator of the multidrug operon emrRAB